MKKLNDIQGYRRSHKKIPTGMALTDDQNELAAKQSAIGKMESPKAKMPNSYTNPMNPIGMGSGGPIQPPTMPQRGQYQPPAIPPGIGEQAGTPGGYPASETVYDLPPGSPPFSTQRTNPDGSITIINHQSATPQVQLDGADQVGGQGAPIDPEMKAKLAAWGQLRGDKTAEEKKLLEQSSTEGTKEEVPDPFPDDPYGMRDWMQNRLNEQLDPEEAERRVIRQRAAQEAMVRATMGAGEAGRSGASALLEGEAGRMAEQKARTAELERTMGIVGLGMELMGFDLDKNRYNKAELRQAALAALKAAEYVDADSAEEIYDMLNIPESARDPEGMRALQDYLDLQRGDGGDTGDEDTGTTTGTNDGTTNPNSNIAAPLAKNPDGTMPSTYILPDGSFTSADTGKNKTTEELIQEQEDQQEHEGRGDEKTMGSESMDSEYFQEHSWSRDDGELVVNGKFIDLPVNANETGRKETFGDPSVEHIEYKYYDVRSNGYITFWYYPGN
tara:strand:- start:1627 stop:3129 length:1503 start_codon:yes stop_codon:yes gene_type:complete